MPLGGQQYIIVDREAQLRRNSNATNAAAVAGYNKDSASTNSPYCLKCFDRVFGEQCETCGKLITCDLGAINHEQHCWHATHACFKCNQCAKSLLGSPFLPHSDGRIFCSLACSELAAPSGALSASAAASAATTQQASAAKSAAKAGTTHAAYDEAAVNELLFGQKHTQQQLCAAAASAAKHRPLIDYLLSSASTDETSYQLLGYLSAMLEQQSDASDAETARLRETISQRLQALNRERASQQNVARRRQELNPFLDAAKAKHHAQSYINLDSIEHVFGRRRQEETVATVATAAQPLCRNTSTILAHVGDTTLSNATKDVRARLMCAPGLQSKPSQCSPAASLASNEGTMSDQSSATSSGVSSGTSAAGGNAQGGSVQGGSAPSPPASSAGSTTQEQPQQQQPQTSTTSITTSSAPSQDQRPVASQWPGSRQPINSITATLERRRRAQPITELSAVELLSIADDMQQQQQQHADGFEQLVSHFNLHKSSSSVVQRPSQPPAPASNIRLGANSSQESFFFELAQRLPKHQQQQYQMHQQQQRQLSPLHVRPLPLDTNGLPTVADDETTANAIKRAPINAADHYSTVNKANKTNKANGDDKQALRDSFFAITSALMNNNAASFCNEENPRLSHAYSTSSLHRNASANVVAMAAGAQEEPRSLTRASSSLGHASSAADEAALQQQQLLQQQQQRAAKTTKSVSFDPAVKDPPSSSGTMTLGRNSGLKSALKSSSSWQQQQQQQLFLQQQWQQHQFQQHMQPGSTSTLPSSFANQLKGSVAAYSAHYDEHGRRVRLSTMLSLQQQQQQLVGEGLVAPAIQQQPETVANVSTDSTDSGPQRRSLLAKLTGGSRGGRREMRMMQQQQQQQQVQTTQPLSRKLSDQMFAATNSASSVAPFVAQQPQPMVMIAGPSGAFEPQQLEPQVVRVHRRESRRSRRDRPTRTRRYRSRYDDDDDDASSDSRSSSRCSTCSSSSSLSSCGSSGSSRSSSASSYTSSGSSASWRSSSASSVSSSCSSYNSRSSSGGDDDVAHDSSASSRASSASPSPATRRARRSKRVSSGGRRRSGSSKSRPRRDKRSAARRRRGRSNRSSRRSSDSKRRRSRRRAEPSESQTYDSNTDSDNQRHKNDASSAAMSADDYERRRRRARHSTASSSTTTSSSRRSHASHRQRAKTSRRSASRRASNSGANSPAPSSSSSHRSRRSRRRRREPQHHLAPIAAINHLDVAIQQQQQQAFQQQELLSLSAAHQMAARPMMHRAKSPSTLSQASAGDVGALKPTKEDNCRLM